MGTNGQSVWKLPNMAQKFQKQKWKTAIWQEQENLCSGVVRIQMTFLQDTEISIGFPNAW